MKNLSMFAASGLSCSFGICFSIGLLRGNWLPLFFLVALVVLWGISNFLADRK